MRQIWMGVVGVAFASLANAQIVVPPACSTLTVFADLLRNTCTLGDGFVLKSASFSRSTTGSELDEAEINFSASYVAGVISVALSGAFQAPIGATHNYKIGFLVDPPPEVIIGFESEVDWGSTTNSLVTQAGTGSLAGSLCSGAAFTSSVASSATCPGVFNGFLSNPANPRISVGFPPTNIVDVRLDLLLSSGAQMNSIFTRTSVIPEPAVGYAAGALGAGLLLALRRKRAH